MIFISKNEVREKRYAVFHNAPILAFVMATPVVFGAAAARVAEDLHPLLSYSLLFLVANIFLYLTTFITDKLSIRIGENDDIGPSGDAVRFMIALPLFFFGVVIEQPMIAMFWGIGMAVIFSAIVWLCIPFSPAE